MVQRWDTLIGPWEPYTPDESLNILFLASQGVDWYKYRDSQIRMKYILQLDETGRVIKAESEDFAQVFPVNSFTLQVDEIPEDFEPHKYVYGDEGFELYVPTTEEIIENNRHIQSKVLRIASSKLMELQGLILAGVATDEETALSERLKAFMKELRAVDLHDPVWPERPL